MRILAIFLVFLAAAPALAQPCLTCFDRTCAELRSRGLPACPAPQKPAPPLPAPVRKTPPTTFPPSLVRSNIRIDVTVEFETAKAVLRPASHPPLDELAAVLKSHAELYVRISAHSDSAGDEGFNRRLTQDRADAVREALIERGIAASRLEAKGYGSSMPIADNRTAAGRARNRRVDFEVLK